MHEAIRQEATLDVMYRASGRHTSEPRRITPLLIEPRGSRIYLMAYCHTRRANRTFRMDRLQLIDA